MIKYRKEKSTSESRVWWEGVILNKNIKEGISDDMTFEMRLREEE